ncbi:hypothetical protein B9G98_01765 [Wickerhamiella sorbophila]|uniref:ABC transporter domain-containing protein n=1 Tax=Wickerhamiella sorbophila TaxID=45607 RepID=A0A2T0FGN7_9ASCO|nr:hypothetical protein B9G98_01765 [Wickerhamiella sorbophila]PRT54145.1 hypothetical protein B9G98_01765 [Wickerhamiella sorbophila]
MRLWLAAATALAIAGALTSPFDNDDCPPCFNCRDPGMECIHYGACNEFTGLCDCPAGFGGPDCASPVCGSLPRGARRPIRDDNGSCSCDNGWDGVNCNMCKEDNACQALMPGGEPGTCYTGGKLVKQNFHMCNVTNRKILDVLDGRVAQVTFGCDRNTTQCDLQLWVDEVESFFCKLSECDFDAASKGNGTQYNCENIECQCRPGELLCGADGSIDISVWLQKSVHGPGDLRCDGDGKCEFNEPEMNKLIKFVFGDQSIQLDCDSSECVHYSEIPGWAPPESETSTLWAAISLVFVAGFLGVALPMIRRAFYASDKPIELPQDDTGAPGSGGGLHLRAKPITLSFQNLSYAANGRDILEKIDGVAAAGSVLAIMGGSGAGKTTLLDILARKNKRGKTSGKLMLNGVEQGEAPGQVSAKAYKRLIGFVDQDDELMPTLTVYETIVTSALLRLPKSMSKDAKKLRALDTLAELGILHLKDRLVGSETDRGLSGGEKRRLAIACELVTSPSILFLDEPTSGLDAYNAYNVVESLVGLARDFKRTVVFTIHQPRSNIVALFDRLVLLAQGKQVFTGTPQQAAEHFASQGLKCAPGYNIADFMIDVTMKAALADGIEGPPDIDIQPERPAPTQESLVSGEEPCPDPDSHRLPPGEDPTREWADFAFHRQQPLTSGGSRRGSYQLVGLQRLVSAYNSSSYAADVQSEIAQSSRELGELPEGYKRISIWQQFLILSNRTFKNLYRNPMLVLTHYTISVVLGLVCGVLYYRVTNDIAGFQNRLGLFFFVLSLFGFSTLTTLSLFAHERLVFVRERANGYYSPFSYYAAKVLLDIVPLRVIPPLILGVIVYPLVGLTLTDGAPLKFLLILVLFNLSAATMMLVIGILISDSGVAILVGCLVNLFGILFAGLFLNQESMGAYSRWLRYLSLFHYAYEALSVNEVRYLSLVENKFGLKIQVPGASILSAFGFDNNAVTKDIAGLGVISCICLVLGYLTLSVCLVERR